MLPGLSAKFAAQGALIWQMTMRTIRFPLCSLPREYLWTFLVFCSLAAPVRAQTGPIDESSRPRSLVADDYKIGPGDVLNISVTDAPEFTGKFRVDQSGLLTMSSLPVPLKADGKTPIQLAKDLTEALEGAKLYRSPTVNVFVDEYHSRTVTVLGAVAKPAVYSLQKRTTLLEIISQAGLLPNSGNKATVKSREEANSHSAGANTPVHTFDLARLLRADDPESNFEVHDGDVVSVSVAEVVYVVGAVTKPGGFVVQDQSAGISALQAIALAEGLNATASSHHVLIIRRAGEGVTQENTTIDLAKISAGKIQDPLLEANDVVFVPTSGSKQTVRVMGQVAMSAVNGIAIYGVGYRVGSIQ